MYFLRLLAKHQVLQKFKYIKIWSDGCGKHFKTYPIHYCIAELQVDRLTKLERIFNTRMKSMLPLDGTFFLQMKRIIALTPRRHICR
jgi:hypothetical protein